MDKEGEEMMGILLGVSGGAVAIWAAVKIVEWQKTQPKAIVHSYIPTRGEPYYNYEFSCEGAHFIVKAACAANAWAKARSICKENKVVYFMEATGPHWELECKVEKKENSEK